MGGVADVEVGGSGSGRGSGRGGRGSGGGRGPDCGVESVEDYWQRAGVRELQGGEDPLDGEGHRWKTGGEVRAHGDGELGGPAEAVDVDPFVFVCGDENVRIEGGEMARWGRTGRR